MNPIDSENQEISTSGIYQHAAKFGFYLGGLGIALGVVIYSVDISLLVTFKFLGLVVLMNIGFAIYAGINFRNSIGGYMPYSQALLHGFIVMSVAAVASTLFNLLLYNVIDPDLPKNLGDAALANAEEMMRNWGAPEDAIEKGLKQARADIAKQFSLTGQLWGFVKVLIGCGVISLITALIVRKNQPEAI